MKINLTPEQTRVDLEALLQNVSNTDKEIRVSNTDISATKVVSNTDNVSDTDSRGKYQNEWVKNNKDIIQLKVPKGTKAILQAESEKRGMSLTKLIIVSLEMYLENN